MLLDKENAYGLDPATPAEIEWAFHQAHSGYTNDSIRRGIIAAGDDKEAISFVRPTRRAAGVLRAPVPTMLLTGTTVTPMASTPGSGRRPALREDRTSSRVRDT